MLGFLFNKVAGPKVSTFLKIDSNTGVSCGYYKIFRNSFLIQRLQWLLLTVLPQYSKVSWKRVLWFRSSTCFQIRSKTSQNVAQIILYYHVTNNFFLAWTDCSPRAFDFRICFGKTLIASDFDKKTYTKRCTSNYVISRVKSLSSSALCSWSGALNFTVWFGKRKNVL